MATALPIRFSRRLTQSFLFHFLTGVSLLRAISEKPSTRVSLSQGLHPGNLSQYIPLHMYVTLPKSVPTTSLCWSLPQTHFSVRGEHALTHPPLSSRMSESWHRCLGKKSVRNQILSPLGGITRLAGWHAPYMKLARIAALAGEAHMLAPKHVGGCRPRRRRTSNAGLPQSCHHPRLCPKQRKENVETPSPQIYPRASLKLI